MTTLASLISMGGFVSSELVQKTITWPRAHLGLDDVDIDVWVRPMNAATFERLQAASVGSRLATKMSALCAFGPEGKESVSEEQANQMDMALLAAINRAIDDLANPSGNA